MAVERSKGVVQALNLLGDHAPLDDIASIPRLGVSRFPVAFHHAGKHAGRLGPTAPTTRAQPRRHQVPGNTQVLALVAQESSRALVDERPIDGLLLQAAELDHLVVDALEQFVFLIEYARRLTFIQRGQQRLEVEWGKLSHQ
ncbi:hypothetical protein D9M69_545340 [compost metagenome]